MMKLARVLVIGAGAAVALVAASVGHAATQTATFQVSTTITGACTIAASPLAFPNYNASSTNNVTQSADLTVNCDTGTTYTVGLNYGVNTGSSANRVMKNGANTLDYNLYTDSTYAAGSVWYDNSGDPCAGSHCDTGTGTGSNQTVTVYGQIVAGSSTSAAVGDTLTDTITATIYY